MTDGYQKVAHPEAGAITRKTDSICMNNQFYG